MLIFNTVLGQGVVVGVPGGPRIVAAAPGLKDPDPTWASGVSRRVSVERGPGKLLADRALSI